MRARDRFFAWIRSTSMMRGDDRWMGGVCSGIAASLGWSVTLVRALVLASTVLFGFGAALYALGWMLLPDARDGRILAEELILGRWDWLCLVPFALFAVAVCLPGPGWLAIMCAMVALWALAQGALRRLQGYGVPRPQAPGAPYAGYGEYGMASDASGRDPRPAWGAPTGMPVGFPGPIRGNGSSPMPYDAPDPSARVSGMEAPVTAAPAPAAPMYAAPSAPYDPQGHAGWNAAPQTPAAPRPQTSSKPRRVRRRPAGPLVVLLALGLTFLSGAAAMFMTGFAPTSLDVLDQVNLMTLWISAVCVAMGVLLVVLGVRGRRAGGMIPVSLCAGFLACCLILASGITAYTTYQTEHNHSNYHAVTLGEGDHPGSENENGVISLQGRLAYATSAEVNDYREAGFDTDVNYWVSDSSPETYDALKTGVEFNGMDYDESVANVDLSQFGRWDHSAADVSNYNGGCPAGQIHLSVNDARVYVTLPDGCPYAFGGYYSAYYYGMSSLGGRNTVVADNYEAVSFMSSGESSEIDDSGRSYDSSNYEWLDSGWLSNLDPADEELNLLLIDFRSGVSGKVTVHYASETVLPDYVAYADSGMVTVTSGTSREHYAVQSGEKKPEGVPARPEESDDGAPSGQSGASGGDKDKNDEASKEASDE